MKSKLLLSAFLLGCMTFAVSSTSVYAQTATASQKSDAERLKVLNQQKRKIDMETERRVDLVRDGQKGLSNSGATQNKIDQIEKEQSARKKALDEHYKKGSQRDVVGLDGKRKNSTQTATNPSPSGVVGLDGKKQAAPQKATPKQSEYFVGMDGKRHKREK